jgi:hypothetical protein
MVKCFRSSFRKEFSLLLLSSSETKISVSFQFPFFCIISVTITSTVHGRTILSFTVQLSFTFAILLIDCPAGFIKLPLSGGCYNVVLEELNWTSAQLRCAELAPNSRLAIVQNSKQDTDITNYLNSRTWRT